MQWRWCTLWRLRPLSALLCRTCWAISRCTRQRTRATWGYAPAAAGLSPCVPPGHLTAGAASPPTPLPVHQGAAGVRAPQPQNAPAGGREQPWHDARNGDCRARAEALVGRGKGRHTHPHALIVPRFDPGGEAQWLWQDRRGPGERPRTARWAGAAIPGPGPGRAFTVAVWPSWALSDLGGPHGLQPDQLR
jgi:hypothetical protein